MTIQHKPSSILVAASLLIGACTSDQASDVEATATTLAQADESSATTSVGSPPTEPTVNTTAAPTTTTSSVPGEALPFGIAAGTELGIIGVELDDSLNFRTQPSAVAEIVDSILTLDDTHTIRSRGDSWATPTSVWWHLSVDGNEAWANQKYLAAIGATFDITDEIGGAADLRSAPTAQQLALTIAASRASIDPESTIVVVAEKVGTASSAAAVTVDVIGLGDDAQKGERLVVTATLVYDDDDAIVSVDLRTVESTLLCARGVVESASGDQPAGICV